MALVAPVAPCEPVSATPLLIRASPVGGPYVQGGLGRPLSGACFAQGVLTLAAVSLASKAVSKTRSNRNRASQIVVLANAESDGEQYLGQVELRTMFGQRARQLLVENAALFEDDLEKEFGALPPQLSETLISTESSTVEQSDQDVLRRRICEIRQSERGSAIAELLYLMVCNQFRRLGAPLAKSVKGGGRVDLGARLQSEGSLTVDLHSTQAWAAVQEHLARSLPTGTPGFGNDAGNQLVQIPLFTAGQLYAMSLQYGYVLQRAESRLRLERALQPATLEEEEEEEALRPLQSYVEAIGPGKFQDMMVTVEAHMVSEEQVLAVFGDLRQQKEELREKLSSSPTAAAIARQRGTAAALQAATASGEVASLQLPGFDLRRLLLEAVAFGSLLRRAEVEAQELCELTLAASCRLDRFGVETDADGNPVVPPS